MKRHIDGRGDHACPGTDGNALLLPWGRIQISGLREETGASSAPGLFPPQDEDASCFEGGDAEQGLAICQGAREWDKPLRRGLEGGHAG